MLKLIKNAHVFAPEDLGIQSILIGGGQVLSIGDAIDCGSADVSVIDAAGMVAVPGFVDSLVHVLGGGGEGGFTTRTPEVQLSDVIQSGVTTLVGALGTDSVGRNLPALVCKTHELKAHGISAFFYTGSYHLPIDTLCGSIQKDLMYIEPCLGVGEVAIADHRGSQPSVRELARVASHARVGGMLSGKAGVVSIHVGPGEERLDLLHQVAEQTDVPLSAFYPTHINRDAELLAAGAVFAKQGGTIDLTTSSNPQSFAFGEIKCSKALKKLLSMGVSVDAITFSSDGHASLPEFNPDGSLNSLDVGCMRSLLDEVRDAVLDEGIPLEQAIQVITSTPAKTLSLHHKGQLKPGFDADVVLMKADSLEINDVICGGEVMMEKQHLLKKGRFE